MNFDKIDETLNTTSETVDIQPIVEESAVTKPSENKDVQKDYEYTRGNLYSLIEKGQETLNGIMDLADQTQSPRAYEVAGQLLKTNADNAEKLVNLQTTKKKVREESGPKNVTNALFVGSTAELQKLIKGK